MIHINKNSSLCKEFDELRQEVVKTFLMAVLGLGEVKVF